MNLLHKKVNVNTACIVRMMRIMMLKLASIISINVLILFCNSRAFVQMLFPLSDFIEYFCIIPTQKDHAALLPDGVYSNH